MASEEMVAEFAQKKRSELVDLVKYNIAVDEVGGVLLSPLYITLRTVYIQSYISCTVYIVCVGDDLT